jgi:hypothetical protein
MNQLPVIDIAVIVFYFLSMIAMGFYLGGKIKAPRSLQQHRVKYPVGQLVSLFSVRTSAVIRSLAIPVRPSGAIGIPSCLR